MFTCHAQFTHSLVRGHSTEYEGLPIESIDKQAGVSDVAFQQKLRSVTGTPRGICHLARILQREPELDLSLLSKVLVRHLET